jgi:hypothetical protein
MKVDHSRYSNDANDAPIVLAEFRRRNSRSAVQSHATTVAPTTMLLIALALAVVVTQILPLSV